MTQQLSPAAQAVLDAAVGAYEPNVIYEHQISIAAALRAAADQVVPMAVCVYSSDFVYVRHQLHAIAKELEVKPSGISG